jgi:hypothetical protein
LLHHQRIKKLNIKIKNSYMKRLSIIIIMVGGFNLSLFSQDNVGKEGSPENISNLLCFWDFQEAEGSRRVSKGLHQYELEEMNGPIKNSNDGIFGQRSTEIEWGQWFRIKKEDAPALNFHGKDQKFTMVAWVKRRSDRGWQYIAGMWNEGDEKFMGKSKGVGNRAPSRQYAMFIGGYYQNDYTTYERSPAKNQAMGYLSPFGGATEGYHAAFDYATGGTEIEKDRWYMVAYSYDGEWIKVYVDGELDSNNNYNPFYYDGPIFDGGENGTDFTIAQRDHPNWPAYPMGVPNYKEGFDGIIGGLAIYGKALSDDEIKILYGSTMKRK